MSDSSNALYLWLELDAQVTHDFCSFRGRSRKCYALLHPNGSYLQGAAGPVVTSTWDEAVRQCSVYGAHIIAVFHEEKIKFARSMSKGGIVWERVLYKVHEDTVQALITASIVQPQPQEPASDKKPSKKARR